MGSCEVRAEGKVDRQTFQGSTSVGKPQMYSTITQLKIYCNNKNCVALAYVQFLLLEAAVAGTGFVDLFTSHGHF